MCNSNLRKLQCVQVVSFQLTQLTTFINDIVEVGDCKQAVQAIVLDFQKTFGLTSCLSHDMLIGEMIENNMYQQLVPSHRTG